MSIRTKNKLNQKQNAASLFKDIHYAPFNEEQKLYDRDFRNWHIKLIAGIAVICTGIFFLMLNARNIIHWLTQ